jgi:succinyl-CoA synthetase beta subunit
MTVPLVVRLQGTKEAEAKQMIKDSKMKVRRARWRDRGDG